jgi:transposase
LPGGHGGICRLWVESAIGCASRLRSSRAFNDRVKILVWDRGGFVLYYKRMERGRFRLPEIAPGAEEVQLDATQLAMLLDGIDVKRVKPPRRWEPARAKK